MEKLRDQHFKFKGGDLAEANAWLAKNQIQGNQLELAVELEPQSAGIEGLKVLKGDKEQTVIGVNRDRGTVFLDRTQSGDVNFHPKFSGVYDAPLAMRDAKVKLHIFVDACSVEVFVNDGEKVFTVLAYPSAASRGLEFFGADNTAKIRLLDVWTLKSIWK
jgi:fructan beta-fructosidase